MTNSMPEESRRLQRALVGAYGAHVKRRLGDVEVVGLDETLAEGERWLASALTELLSLPFEDQRRGPLEIFQEAMEFPTRRLREADVDPPARDPVAEAALPGDVYDLAPASSRDLGEEVWSIHLSWGATKAAAITSGPPPAAGGDGY